MTLLQRCFNSGRLFTVFPWHNHRFRLVKGRQYAMVLLGHQSHSSGIRPRPWFPCSDMVIKTTSTLLYGKTSWHTNAIWYRHGPLVGFHFPRFVIHQAKKKLNLGQSEARRLKRGRPVLTFRIFAKSVHSSPCLGWEWALQTKGNRENIGWWNHNLARYNG